MRLAVRIVAASAVLLLLYAVWPLWGLYRLADAVEHRDAERLNRSIAFPELRQSLSFQISRAVLTVTGQEKRLGRLGTGLVMSLGSVADPLVERFVTPEGVASLLARGWPEGLPEEDAAAPQPRIGGIRPGDLGNVWSVFAAAHYRGRSFWIDLPLGGAPAQQFRIRLRLIAGTWTLVGVDLPEELRLRFATVLVRTRN
ncbi:DUF2939 domain-containing protein [Rhodoplanes roseus]|uniref:DUF2939 domain-containing protein n=1 Tax=Rhodoplanes roseus TaxID=29409 RepID=A0A327L659_9BRAD|nr:DUF2939 domain-containing protein [Rhodoplanes roseus]RAI45857.1 hypothetical protein CH341_01785 [Rhodoplanes roseus]